MKDSDKWLRTKELDKRLDQLVKERGCTPNELNIYDAAKVLKTEPNGYFYKRVREWQQRRASEADRRFIEVPEFAEAEFRQALDGFAGSAMDCFIRVVRSVGGDLDRAAALRVADAERRLGEALAEAEHLIDRWNETEENLYVFEAHCQRLEQELKESHDRELRLLGRLEQRDGAEHIADADQDIVGDDVRVEPTSADVSAMVDALTRGPDPEADEQADAADKSEQPSAIKADRAKSGQVEMPLGTNEDADKAPVDGDDKG